MTVVDVNTGKFTGSGGNLEETVTKNNLEAAEEIVRQLRLRDIGGIIVVDFIDMVLETNRDLVLRRLVECLGRDRTRHQVAEVTSLGLVQMTRKRIGTGLLESFSHDCTDLPRPRRRASRRRRSSRSSPRRKPPRSSQPRPRRGASDGADAAEPPRPSAPSPKDIAAMARHERADADAEAEAEPTPRHDESVAEITWTTPIQPDGDDVAEAGEVWPTPRTPPADEPADQPADEPVVEPSTRRTSSPPTSPVEPSRRRRPSPSRPTRGDAHPSSVGEPSGRSARRGGRPEMVTEGAGRRGCVLRRARGPRRRDAVRCTCRSSARAAPASADLGSSGWLGSRAPERLLS